MSFPPGKSAFFRARRGPRGGFTLIELLVAVAILGIALMAAFKGLGQSGNALREGRMRQMADWVAQNRAAELRARHVFPSPGTRDEGVEEEGGQRFFWRAEFKATPNTDFIRVEISVFEKAGADQELGHLVSFLRR